LRKALYALLVLLLILAPLLKAAWALPAAGFTSRQSAEWTILVYMAADNDLEPAALKDLAEMEVYGSGNGINVVALMDRSSRPYEERYNTQFAQAMGDWSDTRVFYVVRDGYTVSYSSRMIADLGEIDTGDPRVLAGFISTYASKYPAKHYALIIWDHGAAFGGVAFDFNPGDYLTPKEVAEAIRSSGVKLDLIAFDACLMGSFETAYELRGLASYMVASEETVPNDGFPYDYILGKLHKKPGMSPEELGRIIVESYKEFYEKTAERTATLSLIDLRAVREAVSEAKAFAQAASIDAKDLRKAREGVEIFGGGDNPAEGASTVDLPMLLENMAGMGGNLGSAAQAFLDKLKPAIITHWEGEGHRGAQGITIYFPLRYSPEAYVKHSSFAEETVWPQALERAVNVEADVGGTSQAYQAYQATASEIAEGTVNATGGNLYVRIAGLASLDFNGDGDDEIAVVTTIDDFDSETSWVVLSVFDLVNGRMEKAYSQAVAGGKQTMFQLAGIRKADYDGDHRLELYFAVDAVDYSEENLHAYSWIFKAEWSNGKYKVAGLKLDNTVVKGLDGGDVVEKDRLDLVVGALVLKEDGSLRSSIQVYSPADLKRRFMVEASNPSLVIAGITTGRLVEGSKYFILAGMNIVEFSGETATLRGCEVEVFEIQGSSIKPVGTASTEDTGIASIQAADLDGDGIDEIVLLTKKSLDDKGTLHIFKPDQGKKLRALKSISLENLQYVGLGAQIYDIDGDGIKEILVTTGEVVDPEDNYVEPRTMEIFGWMPSAGKLVFESRVILGENRTTYFLPADLNGDQRLDMVYIQRVNNVVNVLIANISNYVDPTGVIKGVVLDKSGNPVKGALVRATVSKQVTSVANTTTDSNGRFELRVPAGSYYVEATLGSGESMKLPVRVKADGRAEVALDFRKKQEQHNPWQVVSTTTAATTTTETTTTQPPVTTTTHPFTTTTTASQPPSPAQTGGPKPTSTSIQPPVQTTATTETLPIPLPAGTGTTSQVPTSSQSPITTSTASNPAIQTTQASGPPSPSQTIQARGGGGSDTAYKAIVVLLVIVAAALWFKNRGKALAALLLLFLLAPAVSLLASGVAEAQSESVKPWWVYRGLRVSYTFFSGSSVTSPWKNWRATLNEMSVPLAKLGVTMPKPGKVSIIGGTEKYIVTEAERNRVVARNIIWVGADQPLQQNYEIEARPWHGLFNGPFWIDPRLIANAREGEAVAIPGENGPVTYMVTFTGRVDVSYEASMQGNRDSIIRVTGFASELPVPPGTYRDVVVLVGKPPIDLQQYLRQGQSMPNARHMMVVDRELGLIWMESYGEISGDTAAQGGALQPLRNSLYVRVLSEVTLDLENRLPPYRQYRYPLFLQPGYEVKYTGGIVSASYSSIASIDYMVRGVYKNRAVIGEFIFYGAGQMPVTLARDWLVNLDTGEAVVAKSFNPLANQELKEDEGRRVRATTMWIDSQAGRDIIEVENKQYRKAAENIVDADAQGVPELGRFKVYTYVPTEPPTTQGLSYTKLYYTENGVLLAFDMADKGQPLQRMGMMSSLKLMAEAPRLAINPPQKPTQGQGGGQTTTHGTTTTAKPPVTTSSSPKPTPTTTQAQQTQAAQSASQTPTVTVTTTVTIGSSGEGGRGSSSTAIYKVLIAVLLVFIAYQAYRMFRH